MREWIMSEDEKLQSLGEKIEKDLADQITKDPYLVNLVAGVNDLPLNSKYTKADMERVWKLSPERRGGYLAAQFKSRLLKARKKKGEDDVTPEEVVAEFTVAVMVTMTVYYGMEPRGEPTRDEITPLIIKMYKELLWRL